MKNTKIEIENIKRKLKAFVLAGSIAGTMTACKKIEDKPIVIPEPPKVTTTTPEETTVATTVEDLRDEIVTTVANSETEAVVPETVATEAVTEPVVTEATTVATQATTKATVQQTPAAQVNDDALYDDVNPGPAVDNTNSSQGYAISAYSYTKGYKIVKKYKVDSNGNKYVVEIVKYDEDGKEISHEYLDKTNTTTEYKETNTTTTQKGLFSTTEMTYEQFIQLTKALKAELDDKHVVKENGQPFELKDLYTSTYINNIDFATNIKDRLISEGLISEDAEANFVNKFSVDDAIHGHNLTTLEMTGPISEVFFAFDYLGPNVISEGIDDFGVYYDEEYNYNPTPLKVNRVINKLHEAFNLNVSNPAEKDLNAYYQAYDEYLNSHEVMSAYEYFLGTDNGEEALDRLERSSGVTRYDIENVRIVDLSCNIFKEESRKEVKDAYNELRKSVDPDKTPRTIQTFSNRYFGDNHQTILSDYGAGTIQAIAMYMIELKIYTTENPYNSFESVTEFRVPTESYDRYFFYYSDRKRVREAEDRAHSLSDAVREHEGCTEISYDFTADKVYKLTR